MRFTFIHFYDNFTATNTLAKGVELSDPQLFLEFGNNGERQLSSRDIRCFYFT